MMSEVLIANRAAARDLPARMSPIARVYGCLTRNEHESRLSGDDLAAR